MGAFTISGAVRPAVIPRLGVSILTVRWTERPLGVKTEPRETLSRLFLLQSESEPIGGTVPTSYEPPFLRTHGGALTWLRDHVFQPDAVLDGDASLPPSIEGVEY